MASLTVTAQVFGPWSLATSRRSWEGFDPPCYRARTRPPGCGRCSSSKPTGPGPRWRSPRTATSRTVDLIGEGDLDEAADQISRFLSLNLDASGCYG